MVPMLMAVTMAALRLQKVALASRNKGSCRRNTCVSCRQNYMHVAGKTTCMLQAEYMLELQAKLHACCRQNTCLSCRQNYMHVAVKTICMLQAEYTLELQAKLHT